MSKPNDGGPAYPIDPRVVDCTGWTTEAVKRLIEESDKSMAYGMSLRDYFAAKAMQADLSCDATEMTVDELAKWAYSIADAMLKARGK